MKTKEIFIFIILIAVVIGIISIISLIKANGNHDEEVMKCIGENSELYVSKTCGHCATQKKDLEEYIEFFKIIDCTTNQEQCQENNILYVPTWIINNENHVGKQSIEQLKELTGC